MASMFKAGKDENGVKSVRIKGIFTGQRLLLQIDSVFKMLSLHSGSFY
jgi:hypothetical protein